MVDLTGRHVLITGAQGGLGAGVVTAFLAAGAHVTGTVHSAPKNPAAQVRYETVDLTSDQDVRALFERIEVPWAVINTVGGFAPQRALAELDEQELHTQLTLNLTTAALITKQALRVMGEGRIVHTTSQAATHTAGAGFAYSVAKAGVSHLVQMAAAEVAGTGVRVNAVSPSIIDTPANRAAMPRADHDTWPTPAQIAKSYLFLASPQEELVNGAILPV